MRSLLLILLLSMTQIAQAVNSTVSDLTTSTTMASEKPWSVTLDANYQPRLREDQFNYTDYTAILSYKLNSTHSFRVTQGLNQKYQLGLDQGENEFEASDTILAHYWKLPYELGAFKFRWVTGVYLPVSIDSQDNDKFTTFSGTLQANAQFGNLSVSLRPFVRYNWYQYKTRISGGSLPALTTGITMVNAYDITRRLSVSGTFSYNYIYDYASQYDTSTRLSYFDDNARGRYAIDLALNYAFYIYNQSVSVYGGYSEGDAYIKDGRYEVYAYDPETSRLSLGLTLDF